MGWVAILIGSIVMRFWDVPILDPILSIAIMTYVLVNVFRNLGKSFRIFLQGTPQQLVPAEIESKVRAVEGVVDVHDLHLWTLDGQYNVATLHVVVAGPIDLTAVEAIKVRVRHRLKELLIEHATIEIEDESVECELGDCADHTHFGKPEEPKHLDFELGIPFQAHARGTFSLGLSPPPKPHHDFLVHAVANGFKSLRSEKVLRQGVFSRKARADFLAFGLIAQDVEELAQGNFADPLLLVRFVHHDPADPTNGIKLAVHQEADQFFAFENAVGEEVLKFALGNREQHRRQEILLIIMEFEPGGLFPIESIQRFDLNLGVT
jgi:hypothetical protein